MRWINQPYGRKKKRTDWKLPFTLYNMNCHWNQIWHFTVKQRKKWSHVGCKVWLAFCLCFWNPEEATKRLVELRAWCFDDKLFMHLSPGSEMKTWKIKADLRHNEYIKQWSGWSGSGSLLEAEWMCLRTWSLQTEAGQGNGLSGHKTFTSVLLLSLVFEVVSLAFSNIPASQPDSSAC